MFSKFFSDWEAKYGLECATALLVDANKGNLEIARKHLSVIREVMGRKQMFSAYYLYVAEDLYDIPMYLAVQALVAAGELIGVGPYEAEPQGDMTELVYTVSEWRVVVQEASLFGAGPEHVIPARDFGEADYIADQAHAGEMWDNIAWVVIQEKCPKHGWANASLGSCFLCREEALDEEQDNWSPSFDDAPDAYPGPQGTADSYWVRPSLNDQPCDVCGVAAAVPGGTRCAGCIVGGREPCANCTLDCVQEPDEPCPF